MGKRRFFLGFLAILVVSIFCGGAHAAGYTCNKVYTSCKAPRILIDGQCPLCTTLKNTSSTTVEITGGTKIIECVGNYTGGSGNNVCTGCDNEIVNYNCNAGYYEDDDQCALCPVGYYCPDGGQITACTNKPASNSEYTNGGAASANECEWECTGNYKKSGNSCVPGCESTCTSGQLSDEQLITSFPGGRVYGQYPCQEQGNGCWAFSKNTLDAVNTRTECNLGYYMSNGTCTACSSVSFTQTQTKKGHPIQKTHKESKICKVTVHAFTEYDIPNGGMCDVEYEDTPLEVTLYDIYESRTCYYSGGAGGTNGKDACTGEQNCTDWIEDKRTQVSDPDCVWNDTDTNYHKLMKADFVLDCQCPKGRYPTPKIEDFEYENGTAYDKEGLTCATCPAGSYCGGDGINTVPVECPAGQYSNGSTPCAACTNIPANATATGPGTTATNCPYSCDNGYSGTSCTCTTPCTSVSNNSIISATTETENIAHGTRSHSKTVQCNGNYTTGGCQSAGGTCSGCSSTTTNYGAWNYNCDTGYQADPASGTCKLGCDTNAACSDLGSGWTGTYNACTHTESTQCSKTCTANCSGEATCPTGTTCTYNKNYTTSGTQYYNGSCNATTVVCPVSSTSCKTGYYKKDGTCTSCPTNSYCAGGDSAPVTCPAGQYSNGSTPCAACTNIPANATATSPGTSATDCQWKCNAGYYKNGTTCDTCPTGSYCPAGTTTPATCKNLPENAEWIDTGVTSEASCKWQCTAGYYKNGNQCTKCEVGKYCPAGSETQQNCTGNPANSTWVGTGITSAASCTWECISGFGFNADKTGCVQNSYQCEAGKNANSQPCAAGSYCPGLKISAAEKDDPVKGCQRTCPTDSKNGSVTSADSSNAVTACYTTRTSIALSNGSGDETCYYNNTSNNYINNCEISVRTCNAGFYLETDSATGCVSVGKGYYSTAGDTTRHACSALTGADATVITADTNATAATACYNTCPDKSITNGKLTPSVREPHYNATTKNIPDCQYTTTVCDDYYHADGQTCKPNVYTITLDHNGGTSSTNTIYLKYGEGWYSDSAATNKITSVTLPKLAGKTCSGYKSGNTFIVGPTGALVTNYKAFTTNATITADYTQNQVVTCVAGQYYPGTGNTCKQCTAGNYCLGTTAIMDINEVTGLSPCPTGTNTYTSAAGKTTTISSAEGATSEAACYATNVAYTTNNGTGSQTCYYSGGKYNNNCTAKTILTCIIGHWRATDNAIDCVPVERGYYSGKDEIIRHACPNKDQYSTGDNLVSTTGDTSEKITQCYLGNIWFEPDNNTGARRTCYHTDNASDTDPDTGYSYNCGKHIIKTCAAGYYDDGKLEDPSVGRVCAPVTDKNFYSPSQMTCKSEKAEKDQPSISDPAGCSTKLAGCPATKTIENGTAKRVFNAEWSAEDFASCEYKGADCDPDYAFAFTDEPICYFDGVCPVGNYCPTDCDPKKGNCIKSCPSDEKGKKGTSAPGSTTIDQCYITYNPYQPWEHGTGHATCYYSTQSSKFSSCQNVQADTCQAGYWYRDEGSFACIGTTNGNYSVANDISQSQCPTGGNGSTENAGSWSACYKNCDLKVAQVAHATSIAPAAERVYAINSDVYAACSYTVTCATGYDIKNNDTASPSCEAKTYTVTLNKNGGEGNTENSVQCTFDSGACALPATTGLTRTGYTAQARWCTQNNGGGTCYAAGQSVTTNISSTGDNITLYATWTPQVYKVTLAQGAGETAAAPKEVYLKYATGWFTDTTATIPLRNITTAPTKTGYAFAGYTSANKRQIISADGNFITSEAALTFTIANTSVNAVWTATATQCAEGTYYTGTAANCEVCPANYYCSGGTFGTDSGTVGGRNECPDGGVAPEGSTGASACYKANLPTYVATHGTGTQTCHYDTESRMYSIRCSDKYITKCDAGYWQENKTPNQANPDCAAVGNGYYSAAEDINRQACPNAGTTASTTSDAIQKCYKTGLDYTATYGTGTQRCFYSSGDVNAAIYNRDCDTKEIQKCRGGYWRETDKATDCVPVGLNYYSGTDEVIRHSCPAGGITNSDITSTPKTCYRDGLVYTAEHGGGKQSCYYTSGEGNNAVYESSCERVQLEYCNAGYWTKTTGATDCIQVGIGFYSPAPDMDRHQCAEGETTDTATSASASACKICPAGEICTPGSEKRETCTSLTNGQYTMSDKGATDITDCYRECNKQVMGQHITDTTGHDYYGGKNTCMPSKCEAGYQVQGANCVDCPAGSFCLAPGADDPGCEPGGTCGATSCASLGDGSWKYSAKGASEAKHCYRKCEQYDLEGGKAIPRETTVYWNNQCVYDGYDLVDNPCEIVGTKCVVKMCKSSYEMINGKCQPCNRENALAYKSGGNCIVETCRANFHPYGDKCVADTTECSAPNAARAEMRWNNNTNAFGVCTILECDAGFHISSNACVADIQNCTVEHGRGEREWNHNTNTWGECIATYCEPGFTNDPSESNEPTKQCGNCKNKFGVGNELAVSTYSRGCTISACMYQGEMYNLENNECNPICSVTGYEDETGTMKWNNKTHKCERTCKDGYSMW